MLEFIHKRVRQFFEAEPAQQPTDSILYLLLGLILLLVCGLRIYSGLEQHMDIQFADEAAYLRFGLDLPHHLNRDWGPLYAIWYKFLSFFTDDTIRLYYLNFRITAILPPLLLFVFLWRLRVNIILAFFISYCILVSDLNISIWPRVSHFCLILLLLGLIFTTFIQNKTIKLLILAIVCLLCSYARPEFYLSFLLFVFLIVFSLFYFRKRLNTKTIGLLAVFVIIVACLHLFFRFPSNNFFGYNRGVAAFYQHYAFNQKWAGKLNANEDAWLNWEDISKRTFGDCNSMWCVIQTQPKIFINNTLFNFKNYLFYSTLNVYSYLFPMAVLSWKKLKLLIVVLLTALIAFVLISKQWRSSSKEQFANFYFYLLCVLFFASPTMLSCIVVFPREHYFYLQMMFWIMLFVSLLNPLVKQIPHTKIVFGLLFLVFFVICPDYSKYPFLKMENANSSLCNVKMVRFLHKNYNIQKHTIFTNMPFVRGMLSDNFSEVNTIFDKKKTMPFQHYYDSAKVDIVIVNPSLFRDPHIKEDATWNTFIQQPQAYNFKRVDFSDCELYLLVKE